MGCSNKSGKLQKKRSFFQVPFPKNEKEEQRATRWLHNIGTGYTIHTFKFSVDRKVCEDHFHPDCFERNLQAEMLGYKAKKQLQEGAVPTIFGYRVYDQINMDGTVVSNRIASSKQSKHLDDVDVST